MAVLWLGCICGIGCVCGLAALLVEAVLFGCGCIVVEAVLWLRLHCDMGCRV